MFLGCVRKQVWLNQTKNLPRQGATISTGSEGIPIGKPTDLLVEQKSSTQDSIGRSVRTSLDAQNPSSEANWLRRCSGIRIPYHKSISKRLRKFVPMQITSSNRARMVTLNSLDTGSSLG